MENIISVIVPTFNNEIYIEKCVKSLLSQDYKSYEIIVIDDGSTDNTNKILENICIEESKVSYFYKSNGGVSDARNYGIDKARGKYICFVDADDYVDFNYLTLLYDNINGCDISIGNIDSKISNNDKDAEYYNGIYTLNEFKDNHKNALNYILMNSPVNKLYKREIIIDYKIKFDNQLSMGEDLIFNLTYFNHVNKISVFDNKTYHYCYNAQSLTNNYKKDYYIQKKYIINELINFFEFNKNNHVEKRAIQLILLQGLIDNEILTNPQIKITNATYMKYISEYQIKDIINSTGFKFHDLLLQYRNVFLIKYNLIFIHVLRLKRKGKNNV